MNLTKEEWNRQAERAAAAKFGEDHAGWYTFKRYGLAPTSVLTGLGVVALGIRWVWTHLHLPAAAGGRGHFPALFWVFLAALIVGTAVAFRPRDFTSAATQLVRAVVLGLLWLGFIVYGLTVVI